MTEVVALPDGSGTIEAHPDEDGHISMIVCRGLDGRVRWQALPPGGPRDAWVSVQLQDDSVLGRSWSCWNVSLDPATGTELQRLFTK